MKIGMHHVALEEESILERVLAPVIVPDPLPILPGLASNTQVPVIAMVQQADILDRIPETLPKRGVPQKTPVLLVPHQFVSSIRSQRALPLTWLGLNPLNLHKKHKCCNRKKSHAIGVCGPASAERGRLQCRRQKNWTTAARR